MRLTDKLIPMVEEAIGKLPVLEAERETYIWEIAPGIYGGQIRVMIALFMPVRGTADDVAAPVGVIDPFGKSQADLDRDVHSLYLAGCQQRETLESQAAAVSGTSPGGLAIGRG